MLSLIFPAYPHAGGRFGKGFSRGRANNSDEYFYAPFNPLPTYHPPPPLRAGVGIGYPRADAI